MRLDAAFGKLRELLQDNVGVAAQVLEALVGDVVIEARKVEGKARPEMVARFTVNAIPAMALLARGLEVAMPLRKPPKDEVMLPQIVEMAEAGSGVDLISRALRPSALSRTQALVVVHMPWAHQRYENQRLPRQPGWSGDVVVSEQ